MAFHDPMPMAIGLENGVNNLVPFRKSTESIHKLKSNDSKGLRLIVPREKLSAYQNLYDEIILLASFQNTCASNSLHPYYLKGPECSGGLYLKNVTHLKNDKIPLDLCAVKSNIDEFETQYNNRRKALSGYNINHYFKYNDNPDKGSLQLVFQLFGINRTNGLQTSVQLMSKKYQIFDKKYKEMRIERMKAFKPFPEHYIVVNTKPFQAKHKDDYIVAFYAGNEEEICREKLLKVKQNSGKVRIPDPAYNKIVDHLEDKIPPFAKIICVHDTVTPEKFKIKAKNFCPRDSSNQLPNLSNTDWFQGAMHTLNQNVSMNVPEAFQNAEAAGSPACLEAEVVDMNVDLEDIDEFDFDQFFVTIDDF